MKLHAPKNPNYAATVVRVRHITVLDNCDNVVAIPVLGFQAIVSKDTQVGDLGIVFGAETQLSQQYAEVNNLHRHGNLNADPSALGYLEDNRRVKALKFRGHRSDALFMPLASLAHTGIDVSQLNEGDTFDVLEGHEICTKYLVRQPRSRSELGVGQGRRRFEPRVDEVLFPKHFDTPNFFRNTASVSEAEHVVITQKLHGTSLRVGHTLVKRKLTWRDRIAKLLRVPVAEQEWAYVYGSRNVVKDPDDPAGREFYGSDIYTQIGSELRGRLPKGFVVYAEIVGWKPGTDTPIQKGYTYRIPVGCYEVYVYRVTTVNEDGRTVDLSWDALKQFCAEVGLKPVPELAVVPGAGEEFVSTFLDIRYADAYSQALPTDGKTVDEGVCLRAEGMTPVIVKAKSPEFFRYESKLLDQGVEDLEAAA